MSTAPAISRFFQRFRPTAAGLALLAILAAAAVLRFHGIDWDAGHGFHPDERSFYLRAGCMYDLLTESPGYAACLADHPETETGFPSISVLLDADRSPLNPHWFPLGSSLIYVLTAIRLAVEPFTDIGSLDLRFAGRTLSALADLGSVFLVYVLGRRMFGWQAGLLAAGLAAVAVIHVQNSHFYRPETFSVCFVLLSFWGMLRVMERRRLRDSLLLGALVGLSMAPKVSVLPLLAPLAVAYGYWLLDSCGGRWREVHLSLLLRLAGHGALAGLCALAVFFILTPYALLDFRAFLGDLAAQANMANHAGLWPFTIQYVDTPPFLYQLRQSVVWGMGIPLGIVAWLSIPFTIFMAWRYPATRRWDLLLLAWVVPQFLFLESFEVRFLRYVFPLAPVLLLLAGRMMWWLVERGRDISGGAGIADAAPREARLLNRLKGAAFPAAVALLAAVVLSAVFYSLAFQNVYRQEHPAVRAGKWFAENTPPGSRVVSDNHWDEFIPGLYRSSVWQFPAYEPDTAEKMVTLSKKLAEADYLVFYSQRPYASVMRDPERFPFTTEYYQQLFRGDLGFRLGRSFTTYPSFLGVELRDSGFGWSGLPVPDGLPVRSGWLSLPLGYADDNVVGYDHPLTLVFRNDGRLAEGEMLSRLLAGAGKAGAPAGDGLKFAEGDWQRQREGGTWSDLFDRDGWANRMPVLAWLLATEGIFLLTLPLAMFIFRSLPDRGVVLARILGLLAVAYFTWLVVSLGWLEFSRTAIAAGLMAVAGLSLLALAGGWRDMWAFLRERWRLLAGTEVLFLLAFSAFLWVRAENPDLWHPYRGGEKPMELAYLTAVIRSSILPPYDPWFAGGYLNYYYWGYFILAVPIRLVGVVPATAFNLAVPLLFALTFTGAWSIGYNLAAAFRDKAGKGDGGGLETGESTRPAQSSHSPPKRWLSFPNLRDLARSPASAGLLTALFLAGMGNLDGGIQVVQNTWGWLQGEGFAGFDYWRSSRMIPSLDAMEPSPLAFWVPEPDGWVENTPHITEFPFFTFLFADLHAHMIVIPVTLLVIGLLTAIFLGRSDRGPILTACAAAVTGVALGSLFAINSWDYPAYVLLTVGIFGLSSLLLWRSNPRRAGMMLAGGAAALILSCLAFIPFHQSYETFGAGADVSKWATPIKDYLTIHGLFVLIAVAYLAVQLRQPALAAWRVLIRPDRHGAASGWDPSLLRVGLAAALLATGGLAVYLAAAGFLTAAALTLLLALTGAAGLAAWLSGDSSRRTTLVPLVFLALALGISIGVDFVRLGGDIGRMNTLFKLYLEVWVLFALASGFMAWRLASFPSRRAYIPGVALAVLAAGLLAAASAYPVLGTQARLADRWSVSGWTLDGTEYMRNAAHFEQERRLLLADDLAGIHWLQENVEGSPVVLEAHTPQYRWGSRIAKYTGLPTVLGWPWHQVQQRGPYSSEVRQRERDIATMYETTSLQEAAKLFSKYEVEYVIVGDLERAYYPAEGLGKFRELAERGKAEVAFSGRTMQVLRLSR